MQPTDATPEPWRFLSDGFLDRYVTSLRTKQVKPTAIRWHVIRAGHYLQAMSHKRLAEHTSQDVTDYLEKLGRIGRLTDWQYGQAVDAIQHLCLMGEVAWAPQFDWAYWKASARTLPVHHPTIARETTPAALRDSSAQSPMERAPLTRVRDTHAAVLEVKGGDSAPSLLDTYGTGI